jgi:hypothetical protein
VTVCRRPDKVHYPTRSAARKAARSLHRPGQRLSAYRCECGGYHIGRLNEFVVAGYSLDRWNRRQEPAA